MSDDGPDPGPSRISPEQTASVPGPARAREIVSASKFGSAAGCLALVAALGSGCTGIFASDPTSVSLGTHARGALVRGVALPEEGAGYVVHHAWRPRGRQYATEEVVRWLTGGFAAVARALPGSKAWLGDLSSRTGGGSREHKSHESGRDIDVFFYVADPAGQPLDPGPAMLRFTKDGRAMAWSPADSRVKVRQPLPDARFDVLRNWALVRALLSDRAVEVQWIFVNRALAELMLRHAAAANEDPALLARAAGVFHQPRDANPHDDHMHIRVFCADGDRSVGCVDRGPQRWWKKRWKYMGGLSALPPARVATASSRMPERDGSAELAVSSSFSTSVSD